ncbi:MAG: hypothetical protein PHR56_08895 [Dehalococcoidales bacterium]|nr:hypothetical protein [Dehalococcoidales bacterium]
MLGRLLSRLAKNERGQVLPIMLAMLALGSLIIIPSLDYASTNLTAVKIAEKKAKAVYTAEAGVADAIWQIRYTSPTMPYTYQIDDINGMSVRVAVEGVTTIAGQEIGPTGVHGGWLKIEKTVSYASGVYTITLTMTNNGDGNMRIDEVLVVIPSNLQYLEGSTSGQLTTQDPEVIGTPDLGITIFWSLQPDYYIINKNDSAVHTYQLTGLPDIPGAEGHSVVKATREDVGTVWDADSRPYSITAQARDAADAILTTLKVGIWAGVSGVEISCWQLNP